jgi:hypothetical protein
MPETAVVNQPSGSETTITGNQQPQQPGWLAGLPAELRDNEAFKAHKTVGDFARVHLETAQKAKDLEGRLANSIPKLGANATQEERDRFFNSIGRPDKPEGYLLDGGDQEKEKLLTPWKQDFFELGLTADQAKGLKAKWDGRINKLVDDRRIQDAEAETKLKADWGDRYPATVELVKRLWKRETDIDLDVAFAGENSANRVAIMRYVFKMAAKTGEDTSPAGAIDRRTGGDPFDPKTFYSNPPPKIR